MSLLKSNVSIDFEIIYSKRGSRRVKNVAFLHSLSPPEISQSSKNSSNPNNEFFPQRFLYKF